MIDLLTVPRIGDFPRPATGNNCPRCRTWIPSFAGAACHVEPQALWLRGRRVVRLVHRECLEAIESLCLDSVADIMSPGHSTLGLYTWRNKTA